MIVPNSDKTLWKNLYGRRHDFGLNNILCIIVLSLLKMEEVILPVTNPHFLLSSFNISVSYSFTESPHFNY